MKFLVFDTETTGIPKFGPDHPADAPYQPRVSQFSGRLISDNQNDGEAIPTIPGAVLVREFTRFFRPDGWSDQAKSDVDMLAVKLKNGITHERILKEGIPAREILDAYVEMHNEADFLVAANTRFDLKMMRAELRRADLDDMYDQKPWYCILDASEPICKMPATSRMQQYGRGDQFKKPSVGQAYQIFFNEELKNAHDAGVDTLATTRILFHLISLGVGPKLPEKAVANG